MNLGRILPEDALQDGVLIYSLSYVRKFRAG